MKKVFFKNLVKQKIKGKTFENLQKRKFSHSKVKHIEHNGLIMQKYLQPNKSKMSKEEAQLIFKLRCRVTETKVNLKGKYDNLDCEACGIEEENQQHILVCKELNKDRNVEEMINYEKLFNGSVSEKLKVARRFKENFQIMESIKK